MFPESLRKIGKNDTRNTLETEKEIDEANFSEYRFADFSKELFGNYRGRK